MYFLICLILFGVVYMAYADTIASEERSKKQLSDLKEKKESLKLEKERCEAELKDLKKMKDIIPAIHNSLIKRRLTAEEVFDLEEKYSDKIETFAKSIGKDKMTFNWFYKEISHLLKIENVEFADEVDEAQKHFSTTLDGMYGEASVYNEISQYEEKGELVILDSINLPYDYLNGFTKDNQIDLIVINCRGIFLLEVKNYFPSKMDNALTITYKINEQGYLELNSSHEFEMPKHAIYNEGNGIKKQMELHKKAVEDVLEKHGKSNYIKFIHNVCVIPEFGIIGDPEVKTVGKGLVSGSKLYSEVLTDPDKCLSFDEIKELEQIIENEDLEERKYTYTVMKDIPDNVMEYMLNYKLRFHPHRRSEEELTERISNIESETKSIEEELSQA